MSLVTQQRWEFWMGDMPMPEGCTSEIMWAMYDVMYSMEHREYAVEQIKFYENLWRKWKPKYDKAVSLGEAEVITDIMKLIKDQIEFWREELTA